jgi:iron complex outermembrane recepter protein
MVARRIIILSAFIFLFLTNTSAQQSRTLTGLVTNADGSPLEGVSVQIKGKKYYSGSQADGIYYIPVQPRDSVLVFWHAEYVPEEIKITAEREYNIRLKNKYKQRLFTTAQR